uniref:AI812156 n=1 Tax=Arundo donax TaxID=35708 RepID=A0A0A9GET9_ARUDO
MAAAAAGGGQTLGRSSFSRAALNPAKSSSGAAGVKLSPNGAAFVSSGIPDLGSKQLLSQNPNSLIKNFVFLCIPYAIQGLFLGEKSHTLVTRDVCAL